MKWTSFWDSYESAIHSNELLPDVDKFNYLRTLLERTAFDSIAGLTLSSTNYQEAVEILKKRFGSKQLIITKHMETLLSFEAVSSDHNIKDLRRLYDSTESHIRSLKAVGVEPTSYDDSMLSSVLLTKLPPDLRLIVSRKVFDADLDMGELLAMFEEELTARERAAKPFQSQTRRGQDRYRQTASTLLSGAQESAPGVSCCYCQQPHFPTDCKSVTDVTARKQILKSSGRCFNCLRKHHLSRDCRLPTKCRTCKRSTTPLFVKRPLTSNLLAWRKARVRRQRCSIPMRPLIDPLKLRATSVPGACNQCFFRLLVVSSTTRLILVPQQKYTFCSTVAARSHIFQRRHGACWR